MVGSLTSTESCSTWKSSVSAAGHARAAEHTFWCPSTVLGPTAFADVVEQLAATSPRNLLAVGHATSLRQLAKPARQARVFWQELP